MNGLIRTLVCRVPIPQLFFIHIMKSFSGLQLPLIIPRPLPCPKSVHSSVVDPLMKKVPGLIQLTKFPSRQSCLLPAVVNFLCVTSFSVCVNVASYHGAC